MDPINAVLGLIELLLPFCFGTTRPVRKPKRDVWKVPDASEVVRAVGTAHPPSGSEIGESADRG